jgi:hypothetical protein
MRPGGIGHVRPRPTGSACGWLSQPLGLAVALKRGDADVQALEDRNQGGCLYGNAQEQQACANDFLEWSGIGPHLGRCTDLSCLPF